MPSTLQVDVYVSPAIPAVTGSPDPAKQWWSPISSTLIQGPTSAVLVDTPISIAQTEDLAAWIKKTAPGKKLKYIYTTHAHGDHYLGNPIILKHFPDATCIATARVAEDIKNTITSSTPLWTTWFPNNQILTEGQVVPESLPKNGEFSIDGRKLLGIDVTYSDTHASSFLHVPDLDLVVAGDIVYGDCYQYLAEATTAEKRKDWLAALDQVVALKPSIVVPGHKRASQVDGPYLIDATRDYILTFQKELYRLRDADKLEQVIAKRYPRRWNMYLLELSCKSSVAAL
ncbi:MBL fold metallo-hydrolase [Aspergillus clavatus NRRL 1]|uniref:Metallo-beta-lactamase superfamily protein n=1 Tax=Aspergillus clavatus (strain ATCC 1007 / CBS 513.65 / DSM 816 / NCTC 3887 / NRRL 1 / QM 1276 / 107) TaxID=344612 RepID=A1C4G7_ASPCL|nr:metallo-beta-lactamase superfamily protein [Aspergillus clavatus NRRL 1]EAW15307.1 metallo-beta-lactamase superfamily protein [Aspergillus clavatus NRRL 1]